MFDGIRKLLLGFGAEEALIVTRPALPYRDAVDDAPVLTFPRKDLPRGKGFCTNDGCEEYFKGIFILNVSASTTFRCADCRQEGFVQIEDSYHTGSYGDFREVRVEYAFDPRSRSYKNVAVVKDVALDCDGDREFTFRTPLILEAKRALKAAESMLSSLRKGAAYQGTVPPSTESIISFDDPKESWDKKLRALETELITAFGQR